MITYLYVKTHNVTGFKYLGKTIRKDPHKYPGSGLHWKRHLKVHGYDYTTEILKECTSKEDVCTWGLYYSELWNVVESKEWANLKPENGDGGSITHTEEAKAKMSAANKGKIISEETKAKISAAILGKTASEETKAKISAAGKGRIVSEDQSQI